MKVNSKNRLYYVFFLMLLGLILCKNLHAAGPAGDELRKRAVVLDQKIKLCEQDIILHGGLRIVLLS